jgi:aspartate aminotransferase-like enzyme
VSQRAWQIIDEVDYAGYDALKPWRTALADRWFPYTPAWQSTAALDVACRLVLEEGLEAVIGRHAVVAAHCRQRPRALGLDLLPASDHDCSPTVTAVRVPERIGWPALDRALRARGLAVGGLLGPWPAASSTSATWARRPAWRWSIAAWKCCRTCCRAFEPDAV